MLSRPYRRPFKAFFVGDRTGHQLSGSSCLLEDLLLSSSRSKGLALFDPQGLKHPHDHSVSLVNGFFVDDLGQALPISDSARLGAAPFATVRGSMTCRRRILSLAVGIDLQPIDQSPRFDWIRFEHAVGRPDIQSGRTEYVIPLGLDVRIVRTEDQILAPCTLIRSGLS